MANITKELAVKIAKKLKVKNYKKGSVHDIAQIFHDGKMIASFGIRRGSKKDLGHDHIPGQIGVSGRDAKLLGQCPLSREEWIEIAKEKGFIS